MINSSFPNFEIYECHIVRVIDGDTYVAVKTKNFHSGRNITIIIQQKIKIRLIGVDTDEVRGKKKTKKGIFVKNYVKELLEGRSFQYKFTGKKDSFGRELGDIKLDGERWLSHHLISMGYGVEMRK